MPLLRHGDRGRQVIPSSGMLVGRSPRCALCIDHPQVSAEHASLRWTPEGWELRDLHSRNGTLVDGRVVTPGEWTALRRGTELQFSPTETWILEDDSPPKLMAVRECGDPTITSDLSLLAIPSDEDPVVVVFADPDGRWRSESEGKVSPIAHGDTIEVAGERWHVYLPDEVSRTVDATGNLVNAKDVSLHFTTSRDGEHVALSTRVGGRIFDFRAHAHHQVTLLLARLRLRDRAQPGVPEQEQGWIYTDELRRSLGSSRNQLNLAIFRIRRQFAEIGVLDATNLIERRPDTGQTRLGPTQLHIDET